MQTVDLAIKTYDNYVEIRKFELVKRSELDNYAYKKLELSSCFNNNVERYECYLAVNFKERKYLAIRK